MLNIELPGLEEELEEEVIDKENATTSDKLKEELKEKKR